MSAEIIRKRFTVDEYYRMAEAGVFPPKARIELIEGEILEMSPIGLPHMVGVNRATNLLARKLGTKAIVSVQNSLKISDDSMPQPDIVLLKPRRDFYKDRGFNWKDALLVIEVADSSLQFDRKVKLPLYARSGVTELWIEDLQHGVIEVYRDPGPKSYATSLSFHHGDTISIAAFPSFKFKVNDLLG